MKEKKDIEIAYSEPENYFPKEVREKYFNTVEGSIKGCRFVEGNDSYFINVNNKIESLACIEMLYDELYVLDCGLKYHYFLIVYNHDNKSYKVYINQKEYWKLYSLNNDDFLMLASDIINKDKRGKNVNHIKIVYDCIIIPQD